MTERKRVGRPRGSGPKIERVEAALAAVDGPTLGFALAAIIADLYPVPIQYSRVAAELYRATGETVDRRTIYDWLQEAQRRLAEATNRKEHNVC